MMLGDLFMSALEMLACPFEEYSQQGIAYQIFGLSSHHGIDKFKNNKMVSRSFRLINDVSTVVSLKRYITGNGEAYMCAPGERYTSSY